MVVADFRQKMFRVKLFFLLLCRNARKNEHALRKTCPSAAKKSDEARALQKTSLKNRRFLSG